MVTERQGSRRLFKIAVITAGLAVVALITTLVFWVSDGRGSSTAKLPDGTVVKFLGVSAGTAEFTTERKWMRAARRILPAKLQEILPDSFTVGGMLEYTNSVTVHFLVPESAFNSGRLPLPWYGVMAEDDWGFQYERIGSYGGSHHGNSDMELVSFGLASFPRRESEFWLRLLDKAGKTVGSFRVKNPLPGTFAEWNPQPLPQTCTNGPLNLVLDSLELSPDGTTRIPHWRLDTADPAWQSAEIDYPNFSDCTGNLGFPLSPREKAWKVRTTVKRRHPKDFAPGEKVIFTNVSVPQAGTFTAVDQVAKCGDCEVKLLVFAPAGEFGISNGITRFVRPKNHAGGFTHSAGSSGSNRYESWTAGEPFVLVEIRNFENEDECLFSCREGSEVLQRMGFPGYTSTKNGSRIYYSTVALREGARSISIEVMLSRPLAFEFLLDPADPRITRKRLANARVGN